MYCNRAIDAFVKRGVTIACAKNVAKRSGCKKFGAVIFNVFVQPMNDTITLSYSFRQWQEIIRVRKLCIVSLRIKLHDAVECRNGS